MSSSTTGSLVAAPPFVANGDVVYLGSPMTRRGKTPGGVSAIEISKHCTGEK